MGRHGEAKNYSTADAVNFFEGAGLGNAMMREGTKTVYDYLNDAGLKCAITCNFFVSQDESRINHFRDEKSYVKANAKIDWIIPNFPEKWQSQRERPPDIKLEDLPDGISWCYKEWYQKNFDTKMWGAAGRYLNHYYTLVRALPNVLTLYFGGNDHYAHLDGRLEAEQEYLMLTIDANLGRFLNLWKTLTDQQSLGKTLFVICADHGHTPITTANQKRFISQKALNECIKALGYDVLDKGEVFGLMEGKCVVIVKTTAGVAHVYVRKGSSQDHDWKKAPTREDLRPILNMLKDLAKQAPTSGNRLAGGIDFVLVKDESQSYYQIYYAPEYAEGINGPIPENFRGDGQFISVREQCDNLCSLNSGDILIVPKYTEGFRFEDNEKEANSTHGSLQQTDMYVPLIFATPFKRDLIRSVADYPTGVVQYARNVDIVPTILKLLGIDLSDKKFDGKPL